MNIFNICILISLIRQDQIWNCKYVWSIFVVSASFVPLEIYTVTSQLTILPRFQWGGIVVYTLIAMNAPIMRMAYSVVVIIVSLWAWVVGLNLHTVLPKLQSTKQRQIDIFTSSKGLQSSPIFIKKLFAQLSKFGCFSAVRHSKSPNLAER